jgi:hypothetical protein
MWLAEYVYNSRSDQMETIYWVSSILNILAVLGIIVGLWIAGRLFPALLTWLHSENRNGLFSRPLVKILLWLALGAFFTLPLLDFVGWLGNLVNVAFAPQEGGEFSTILGTVTGRVYSIFPLFLMLAVYGIIVYLAKDYISIPGHFNQTERIFIVFGIASLVYQGVHNIFSQVFSFQLPIINVMQNYGLLGYLIEVLVGIAILTEILIGINRLLPNHPARSK